jgi:Kdo2-lipid IVA lauroyltransferase/acyltransferase
VKILNWGVYAIVKAIMFLGRVSSFRLNMWIMGTFGALMFRIMKKRRALMMYNLEIALGDTTTLEEREEIARKSFISMFYSFAELLHMEKLTANYKDYFEYEGIEIVQNLVKEGKGFFVFGGHFGAWLCPQALIPIIPDIPGLNVVAKPLRNPYMQELLEFMAKKMGGGVITTRGMGNLIVERVEQGHLVGLYMDQESRRKQGIFVNFFGRPASSHVVPGYLAWKNNIPMIPYWIVREKPGQIKVILREPLKYELTDDKDENNKIVAQAIADEVERTIREHPDQWLWAHNRWRRRPDGTKIEIFEKRKKSKKRKGQYLSSKDLAEKMKNEK